MENKPSPYHMLPISSVEEVAERGVNSYMALTRDQIRQGQEVNQNSFVVFCCGYTGALMDIGYPRENTIAIINLMHEKLTTD